MLQLITAAFIVATLPAMPETRLSPGYDCAEPHGAVIHGDCLTPGDLSNVGSSPRPWPDWGSSDTYFGRWKGYTVNTADSWEYEKFIHAAAIAGDWLALRPGLQRRPVLVLVGGRIFVISSRQKPFFNVEIRRCPECVDFVSVAEADPLTRELISMRLDFMLAEGTIPDSDGYDTILYYRDPQTWTSYGQPLELADIVSTATTKAAELAPESFRSTMYAETILQFGRLLDLPIPATVTQSQRSTRSRVIAKPYQAFVRDWLLSPHDLRYKRMIGPSPTLPDYVQPAGESRSPWRRMVDKELRRLGYTDTADESALECFRREQRWDPMGDSVTAMQYFRPLRSIRESISWDTYSHRYGVSSDPEGAKGFGPFGRYSAETVAIYQDEERRRLAELADTNAALNEILGTDTTLDALFGRGNQRF